ncbi:MAG TPA: type VI secretion system-associated FHA domain protein TagH [Stellaceae bacterium]|nr:type VI secretion system-associated FHA domain protein TagH [Stellaceae bacterium]
MPIILHVETWDPALGEQNVRRVEVVARLKIGRGPGNDLVLPDPQRYLSKTHCVIEFDGRGGTVTDTSTNGVFLDDSAERLPRNVPTALCEGSVLRLGGYKISVAAIAPSLPTAPRPVDYSPMAPGSSESGGPLGDPLAGPPLAPSTASDGYRAELRGSGTPRPPKATASAIPEDLLAPAAPPQWDALPQADHTPAEREFFAPPKVASVKIPDDWDASADSAAAGRAGHRPPDNSRGRAREGANPFALKPTAAAAPGRASGGDSLAVAQFLSAAGLDGATLSDAEKIQAMQVAGEIFMMMVVGIGELLAARTSTKQEFRIERTRIGAAGNNPLKFSDNPVETIRTMLLGSQPAFLPAREAVKEALGDITSHQIAMLSAMQVALATVIARFDPKALEDRLEQRSLLDGILPGARKARYWETFKLLYAEIANELHDDFQKVFGAEFARAYRKQVDRIRRRG